MADDYIDQLIADALGGGGGSSGETWGEPYYDAALGQIVQRSSRGSIRKLGAPASTTSAPNPIYPNDRNGDGLDDSTGLANGVQAVGFSASPTGYAYNGIPTDRQGRMLTPAELQGFGGSSGEPTLRTINGKPAIWNGTEFVPAPIGGGLASTTVQPTSYGGGGGYELPRDYIGEANAKAQGQIAAAQAEAAAAMDRDAAQAALQRQLLEMQQGFTGGQNALDRAMQAQQLAQQAALTNAQLRDQYEASQKGMIGDYRESLRDYDARAVWDQMRRFGGSAANVLNANQGGELLTDNALAGSAALFEAMNKPYQPISTGVDWSQWGLQVSPTGAIVPATGGAAGAPGTPPAAGGVTNTGTPETPGAGGLATNTSIPMTSADRMFQAAQAGYQTAYGPGAVPPEELAKMIAVTYGGRSPGDPLVSGNYSGVWQSVDPSAPNYKPPYEGYEIPGYTYDYNQMGLVPNAIANPTKPVSTSLSVPGLASGGMAKGAFITGEGSRTNPSEHSELMIAPGGAQVIPLTAKQAKRLMDGGLASFAGGTAWRISQAVAGAGSTAPTNSYTPVAEPASDSFVPQDYYYPQPVYQPYVPQVVDTGPASLATGGTATSPSVSSTPSPPVSSYTDVKPAPSAPVVPYSTDTGPSTVSSTPPTVVDTGPSTTATQPVATSQPTGGLAMSGTPTITPEQQALIGQIRDTRLGTADMGFNPWDVSFQNLSPLEQQMYFRNAAQRTGLPEDILSFDVNRNRLAGVSGGLAGRLGY